MGLNFYHAFLLHKATISGPLYRLLAKYETWVWGQEQQNAFIGVKQLLASNQVFTHCEERKQVILASDASQYGIGAVLSHPLPDGTEAPIAFY